MNYYLGIDGGGTKTHFLLADENGNILAESIQPTCHYMQCGFDGVYEVLKNGADYCKKQAGITKINVVFAACAGYGDIDQDCARIEEQVYKAFPGSIIRIGNDAENALAGSLGGECGINIIAGTGSIASGIDESGHFVRCGGWHHIFGGDEGSAYWIACKIIQEFTKQSDGRKPKTRLYHYLKEVLHLNNDSDILTLCVSEWDFDRTKIASLARYCSELADQQDEAALLILKEAASELAQIILATYEQLSLKDPVTISYSGGVFHAGKYILDPLRACLPDTFQFLKPRYSPAEGALLLAYQTNKLLHLPAIKYKKDS